MPDNDPLEGIERRTVAVQTAVLANEMRNQARRIAAIERAVRSVQVSLWALAIALITSSVTILATYHH